MIAADCPTTAADIATERTSRSYTGPGPIDQQSIIAAVIAGQITTREAADILGTSPDQIRALKSRAIKRAAKPPTAAPRTARAPTESNERDVSPVAPVSPPSTAPLDDAEQHAAPRSNGAQIVDAEGQFATNPPDVASETLDAIAQAMHTITDALGTASDSPQTLQSLQDGPPETLSEGGETPNEAGSDDQTQTETAPETPSETRRLTGGGTRHPASLANLAKGVEKAKNRQPDDEGSFELEELNATRGLIKALASSLKGAENGRDAQAYSAALLNVADFRRRAAGKSSTLVKEAAPKGNNQRNALVVIQSAPPAPVAKAGRPTPQVIDMESESLNDAPPALKAALSRAPAYVASL